MTFDLTGTLERMKMVKRGYPFSTLFPSDVYEIIQALQEKAERENPQPLTFEELREMVGEPVWVEDLSKVPGRGGWCSVGMDGDAYIPWVSHWWYEINDYGETWLAYRTKPKEGNE